MRNNPLASLLSILLLALLFQLFGRYLFDYALDPDGLSFRLFRSLRVLRIRYEDIAEIQLQTGIGLAFTFWSLHLNNRLLGSSLLLRKRRGLYRSVTLTPDAPERFAAELRRRCG
jgi:hypothetical protein